MFMGVPLFWGILLHHWVVRSLDFRALLSWFWDPTAHICYLWR